MPRPLYVAVAILLVLATGLLELSAAMLIVPIGWMLLFAGRASDIGRLSWCVPGLALAGVQLCSRWIFPFLRAEFGLADTKDLFALVLVTNFGFAALLALPATAAEGEAR